MACTNCTQTTATITGFIPVDCTSVPACGTDASCIIYTGPALNCSEINPYDDLTTILQKIDPLLCAVTGDYSTYNTYCLAPITTQKEFVEAISLYVCTLREDLDTFTDTTFPAYQSATNARLVALEVPGITCASASVVSTDTLQQVLSKYCTKFGSIDALLNISGASWSQCYTVNPAPTTLTEGFDALIDQICLLKAQVTAGTTELPTFNNVGSCLPAPLTATDTLVDTVNKIKIRLCQTGTIDTSTITWGCVTQPSGAQNLQDTLQNIITKVTTINQNLPLAWSADFVVTNVDNGDLCLGKNIALAIPSAQDRFVAATASDATPGTLQAKMVAGTNITLDFSTPTQVTINSSGGVGTGDHKVMVDGSDTTPDYLGAKLGAGGVQYGVQVYPTTDSPGEIVNLNVSINPVNLFQALLDALSIDAGLYTAFCNAVAGCPSPCDAPSNVQVVYQQGTTTTTTTTTTSTTTTTTTTL